MFFQECILCTAGQASSGTLFQRAANPLIYRKNANLQYDFKILLLIDNPKVAILGIFLATWQRGMRSERHRDNKCDVTYRKMSKKLCNDTFIRQKSVHIPLNYAPLALTLTLSQKGKGTFRIQAPITLFAAGHNQAGS